MLPSLENGNLEAWELMYIDLRQSDTAELRSVMTESRRTFVKYIWLRLELPENDM